MNEFGEEIGIESALLKEPEEGNAKPMVEEWVELNNGCLCCSVKDNFVQALEALMGRRNKFDYILIETTGLANPGPVASALWTDPEVEAGVCLDAIVTVVDARNIHKQLDEEPAEGEGWQVNEAQQQVAYADIVVVNKADLASDEELRVVRDRVLEINASAEIIEATRSRVDLGRILGVEAYNGTRAVENIAAAAGEAAAAEAREEERGEGHHGHSKMPHSHGRRVTTVTLRAEGHVDMARFKLWLDGLLWGERSGEATQDIFRMKGILNLAGSSRKQVFQAVRELYEVVEGSAWAAGEERKNRIVVIGRNLDLSAMQAALDLCVVR
jgi:G3E family GTPase